MPKNVFQKSDAITFTFSYHCTVKNKDISLQLWYACCLNVAL